MFRFGMANIREMSKIKIFIILGLLVFIAHYLKYQQFGLYEDDYIVSDGMSFTWAQTTSNFINCFKSFERPVGFFTITFFPYLASKVGGGIESLHLLGFFIVWLNAVLIYILIKHGFSQANAFAGAVIFILFPADTTKGLLIHAFHLQQSLTYLLLACIFYVKNKKVLSYAIAILPLLTYESAILPFFAVPLLAYKWDRAIIKKIALHLVVIVVILTVYSSIRLHIGAGMVAEKVGKPADIALKTGGSMIIGPIISGSSFIVRPITALMAVCSTDLIDAYHKGYYYVIVVMLLLSWALSKSKSDDGGGLKGLTYKVSNDVLRTNLSIETDEYIVKTCKLSLVGIIVIIISYGLAFTHFPPTAFQGRATSVHLASTIGWSLLGSGLLGLALQLGDIFKKKNLAVVILSLYLSLLALFHIRVQDDYVKSWKIQKEFWSEVLRLCPDMTEKTIIFFDKKGLEKTTYIETFSWAVPVTLEQIYSFPVQWERPPRVFPKPEESEVVFENMAIRWHVPTARWWSYWDVLTKENTIFLQYESNRWVRKNSLSLSGLTFPVKSVQLGENHLSYNRGVLYKDILEN